MKKLLVLVGGRRKALEAADALGVPVIVVSDRKVGKYQCLIKRLPAHAAGDSEGLTKLVAGIDKAVASTTTTDNKSPSVASVIALNENTVLPASEIRAALNLPGLTPAQATTCTDKLVMKRQIRAAGLSCPDFCSSDDGLDRDGLIERLGMPMFIKPRVGSGGRGARLISNKAEVPDQLQADQIAERVVSGREMSIESFLLDGEILFSNITDYFEPRWANIAPADLNRQQLGNIETLNKLALKSLSIKQGVTHLEFFLQDKRVVFGEIAARPPGGHLLEIISRAWGFDAWQAVIRLALGDLPEFPHQPVGYSGVRILHPGPGIVEGVDGVASLSAAPSVRQIILRAEPGKRLAERASVGEEVGHVIVADSSNKQVQTALRMAAKTLRFRMRET